jgi:hypothetical protein
MLGEWRMKKGSLPIIALITLLLCSVFINMFQWLRSRNVSARPAIIKIWSDGEEAFENDTLFEGFKEAVSSREFIENILEKQRYRSIRKKFLSDWNPKVTKTEVSDRYPAKDILYWGRERRILSELIDEIYVAITLERNHYGSLSKNSVSDPNVGL